MGIGGVADQLFVHCLPLEYVMASNLSIDQRPLADNLVLAVLIMRDACEFLVVPTLSSACQYFS